VCNAKDLIASDAHTIAFISGECIVPKQAYL
jgi:hypothetical protein